MKLQSTNNADTTTTTTIYCIKYIEICGPPRLAAAVMTRRTTTPRQTPMFERSADKKKKNQISGVYLWESQQSPHDVNAAALLYQCGRRAFTCTPQ